MHRFKAISAYIFGAFLLFAGVNHFLNPQMYAPFVPSWLPLSFANLSSGILEIILGIGLFISASRKWAAWGALVLMLIFLPIHIWDVLRDDPAIGSATAAYVRLPIQFLFIGWMWWLAKSENRRVYGGRR